MGRFFVGGVCCGGYFKSLESALYLILLLLPHLGKERCFIALISIFFFQFFLYFFNGQEPSNCYQYSSVWVLHKH
jgi:hypothetical protein